MTEVTLDATCSGQGRVVLDVASGAGQDSVALAQRGARVIGAEPSARMTSMAEAFGADKLGQGGPGPVWVRGWADALPFAAGSFDASFCKGAMDHFDSPEAAIAEMVRVTKRDGHVVLAIANFDSLACRVTRAIDEFREDWLGWGPLRERRGYDTPSDHFTRFELALIEEQASRHLEIERVQGVSVGWGLPGWATLVCYLPRPLAQLMLRGLDALARQWPTISDVVVLVGRPRLRARELRTTSR